MARRAIAVDVFSHPSLEIAPASFEVGALFVAHGAFVLRCARHFGVADADLEDVVQNVFVVVQRKLRDFDGRSPRSWLFGITRRVAADERKRAHHRREIAMPELAELHVGVDGFGSDAAHSVQRREASVALQNALATLAPAKRDVFVLFEFEDMSTHEVAAAVGCPLKTAYARLYAARKHVLAHVKRLYGGAP